MAKYRNYDHQDPFFASTVDALMEFTGVGVHGLRLTCPNGTTVRAGATTNSGQVAIGIDGLWRYRSTNYDVAISGSAGTKSIWAVAVTANDFSDDPVPDTDDTVYNFELRMTTGAAPSSVAAYRLIAEVDWSGTAIIGLRQLVGAGDTTLPVYPTAPRPGAPAAMFIGASGQTGNIVTVVDSTFTELFGITASGQIYTPGALTVTSSGGLAIAADSGKDTLALTAAVADVGITLGGDVNFYRAAANVGATDDDFRIANAKSLLWRNAANNANLLAMQLDSGNDLLIAADDAIDEVKLYGAFVVYDDFDSPGVMMSVSTVGDVLIAGKVGFNNASPVTRPDYTLSNVGADRVLNADSTSLNELADVVGTIINDLISYGLFQ